MSENKIEFPQWFYKCGTAIALSDDGLYTAEAVLVTSAEQLAALGKGWCDSPALAGAAKKETPAEPAASVAKQNKEEVEAKSHKKVK
ncbi:MAG: hypothetical protein ACREXY_05475 [Gammaproteobacteria bacterium]